MYVIRPGEPGDHDQLLALVRGRAEWMRDRGFHRWEGLARSADALADQLSEPDWPVWVITETDGTLLGCTTATDDTPPLGWTDQERAEPATFLVSTVTDSTRAGRGVGMVIAFWALDHAARQGHQWVRRGVLTDDQGANSGLIRYYRRQGWRVVRAITHPRRSDITVWSLARPAEPQCLDDLIAAPYLAVPTAVRGPDRQQRAQDVPRAMRHKWTLPVDHPFAPITRSTAR